MKLKLSQLYNDLYKEGYHSNLKNHGLIYAGNILLSHDFDSFLDVGCSQGALVKVMQRVGKNAHGVDVSSVAIEQSKTLGLETCVVGSAESLPYDDDSFDFVFTSETLEHLPPKKAMKAVSELLRVAKHFVGVKIAYTSEVNRDWVEIANDKGYKLKDLHLTIRDEGYWRNLFQEGTGWKPQYEYHGMIVYRRKGGTFVNE